MFISTLAPMSIWLLSAASLARPAEILLWALCCAVSAATIPGRALRIGVWTQLLLMPLTAAWIGAVALTGAGPSIASTASVSAGAFHEVFMAMGLVAGVFSFWLVLVISIGSALYSLHLIRQDTDNTSNVTAVVFLLSLAPLSLAVLDGGGIKSITRLMGPESRVSVVWLSHAQLAKEIMGMGLSALAFGKQAAEHPVRQASAAPHEFDALDGVAVFMIGESLRADALVKDGRGPWSAALAARLQHGLGIRLPDACAGGNATFVSVPRLLTAVDVSDEEGVMHKPSILARAKAGGAKTAYINNHEVWVFPELGHDYLVKTSSIEFNAYDEVAVEALGDFLKRTKARSKAAVLHLYGQHFNYEDRYPASAFAEEPSGLNADDLLTFRYGRTAEYGLKTLLLTADLLDQQSDPAFLVFTSDHGENLPSDHTGKRFHAGAWVGKNDTTVPAIILWNDAFVRSGRLERIEPLLHAQGLIAHRDLANAWMALVGAPGIVSPTQNPKTWGTAAASKSSLPPIACSDLSP
jgi:glucan phosphoethanolaminetransferase (alkaline phosphatase superfamily)